MNFMSNNTDNFPSWLEAIFLVLALFMAEFVVAALLYDLNPLLQLNQRELMVLASLLGNGLLFTYLTSYKNLSYAALFHDSGVSIKATIAVLSLPLLSIVPGILLLVTGVQSVLEYLAPLSALEAQLAEQVMAPGLAAWIASCLLAPVLEEMLFRGIILRSLLLQYQPRSAMLISALIFGVAHLNLYQCFTASIVGFIFAWLYQRTRSLWPGILLHATINTSILYWSTMTVNSKADWLAGNANLFFLSAFLFGSIGVVCLRKLLPAKTNAN